MVVIRLSRGGAKKAPFYHIVAADKRDARDGRFIERLGYFNPEARGQESRLVLNKERIEYWISKGAQPSGRVSHLVKTFNEDAAAAAKGAPKVAEMKKAQQEVSAAAVKKKMELEKKEAAAAKEEETSGDEPRLEEASKASQEETSGEPRLEEASTEETKPEEDK